MPEDKIEIDWGKYKFTPYKYQEEGIEYGLTHNKWLLLDEMGLGKALSPGTPVLTPHGFVPIDSIHPGDKVFDTCGKISIVTAEYNQPLLEMYEIEFSTGETIKCCADHLWNVIIEKNGREIIEDQEETKNTKWLFHNAGKYNIRINFCEMVEFNYQPITSITEVVSNVVDSERRGLCSNIPEEYKINTPSIRLELLRSLINEIRDVKECSYEMMSEDCVSFNISSNQVAADIKFLTETLGGYAQVLETAVDDNIKYRVSVYLKDLIPFLHTGTYYNHEGGNCPLKRYIKTIRRSKNGPGKCITVDSESKTYLIKNCIPTHNTLQLITVAEELKRRGKIDHCLVICGINSLKVNWKKEIGKFTDLSCCVLGEKTTRTGSKIIGSIQDRIKHLKSKIEEFFVITNIETLRNPAVVQAIQKGPNKFGMIIIDEIHKIANPSSQQAHNILKLQADYQVGATGTLITNNPLNAYAPLKWLGVERSSFTAFKYFYCEYGGPFHNIVCGFKNMSMLKDIISKHSLRRTKDVLELPPKTIINEYVEMDDKQATFYNNIKQGIKDQVDKIDLNTSSLLALITRLRQATECPSYLTTENIPVAKIDRAVDLVNQIVSNGDKVVVFSTFKETLQLLSSRLGDYAPLVVNGESKECEVEEIKEKFQLDPKSKILLATWQKMGTGHTLTSARYMIFLSIPYTNALYTQAQDRIYRIGSSKPVFIYHLITENTVDERVLEIVEDKSAISDFLIDGSITNQSMERLKKYIVEEL